MSQQIDNDGMIEVCEQQPETLPSVGSQLRSAREGRGLQLTDIAQTLKLGLRQVEALERDDWGALPGNTFIRGFVRNYARLLGLDAAQLMAQLERQLQKPADALQVPEALPARINNGSASRDGLVVGIGTLLLVLAGLAYYFLPSDLGALRDAWRGITGSAELPAEVTQAPPAVQEALFPPGTTPQQVIAPQEAATDGTTTVEPVRPVEVAAEVPVAAPQLRFVLSQTSWLEIRDRADTVIFSQRLPAGAEQIVEGQAPLTVTVGYAPGVKLFLRGQIVNLQPHTRGDVARLVLE